MNWVTVHIKGRKGFKEEVERKLFASDLPLLPGYETGISANGNEMYWVQEGTSIRQIKEAIGSKLVWKYRLQVVGEQQPKQPDSVEKTISLSDSEKQLVTSMRKRMRNVA